VTKWIILFAALAGLATVILLLASGGGETDCYPPVESGQPESAEQHGLVSEECKSK
jgi:hypothetical protein